MKSQWLPVRTHMSNQLPGALFLLRLPVPVELIIDPNGMHRIDRRLVPVPTQDEPKP